MRILILPILFLASTPLLVSASGVAVAQTNSTVMPGSGGGQGPGGLSAQDIKGKRLLDANGTLIGRIEGVSAGSAVVLTPGNERVRVDLGKLSLGAGPHTVIESGNSDADGLNRRFVNGTVSK